MAKFSDEFHKGFGDAIDDIRAKYEEAVYGRTVTERGGDTPAWPQAQEQEQSFGSVTRNIDMGPTHDQIGHNANYRLAQMERELNAPHEREDRDADIDR
jgi:hypothetical protein